MLAAETCGAVATRGPNYHVGGQGGGLEGYAGLGRGLQAVRPQNFSLIKSLWRQVPIKGQPHGWRLRTPLYPLLQIHTWSNPCGSANNALTITRLHASAMPLAHCNLRQSAALQSVSHSGCIVVIWQGLLFVRQDLAREVFDASSLSTDVFQIGFSCLSDSS